MRKNLLIIALSFISYLSYAQWTSPGNGRSYTMEELVQITNGTVTDHGMFTYDMNGDLTISTYDTLLIDPFNNLRIADQVLVTIQGSMICHEGYGLDGNHFYGKNGGVYNWRFENASNNYIWDIHFSECGGIKIMESDVTFQSCEFAGFSTQYCSSAIDYFQCSPKIFGCSFHDNEGPAIGSGANIQGSPEIVGCTLYNNVTSNANKPQINIGPSGATPIRIEGNRIEGTASDMVGGIAIMNLTSETTQAIISQNLIKGNRYGYTQMGYGFDVAFYSNDVIDNNLETNPMNGGSGLSIYGYDPSCKITLRDNNITGNLWGITAINKCDIDLGTETDPGNNSIYGNGNGGTLYELYNNSTCDISAIGNYWGANDANYAESVIFHQPDLSNLGLVNYTPIKELHPVLMDFSILAEDNYLMEGDYQGIINQEEHTVTIDILEDYYIDAITIRYHGDIGVTGTPASGERLDFTEPLTLTLSTFHGETQDYTVTVNIHPEGIGEASMHFSAYPNPCHGELTLSIPMATASLAILNTLGQTVLTKNNYHSGTTLDLSSLKAGTYFVLLFQQGKICTKKTIVLAE